MIKRTAAAISAAPVLTIGGTGAALASGGADDPSGHHQEHTPGPEGKGHHHHHHGKGNKPGDDNGGKAEEKETPAPSPTPGEYEY